MLRRLDDLPLENPVTSVHPVSNEPGGTMVTIEPGRDYEIVVDFQPSQSLDLEMFYSDLSQMGTPFSRRRTDVS